MTFRRRGQTKRTYCFDFDGFLSKNEMDLNIFAEDREEMEDFVGEVIYYWDIEFLDPEDKNSENAEEIEEIERNYFIKDLKKYYGIS